jgi:hypothetical protein
LRIDDDSYSRRIVVDDRRGLVCRDVAEKEHCAAGHALLGKGELRIQRAAANPNERPPRRDASVAFAEHLDQFPDEIGDRNPGGQRDVQPATGADDGDARRYVDVVYLIPREGAFLD